MTVPAQIALGRLPHDPVALAAVPQHMAAESPPPPELPRDDLVWTPALVQNDRLPTCVVAGLMNSARVWCLLQGFDLAWVDDALLAVYARLAGCQPTQAAIARTDGLVMLDALGALAVEGFDIGEQAPLVPEFRAIDPANLVGLREVIFGRGSALVGVTLHQADVQPDARWLGGIDGAGPEAGGHCILPYGYRRNIWRTATWGEVMEPEPDDAWLSSRIAEAYSLTWTMAVAP